MGTPRLLRREVEMVRTQHARGWLSHEIASYMQISEDLVCQIINNEKPLFFSRYPARALFAQDTSKAKHLRSLLPKD